MTSPNFIKRQIAGISVLALLFQTLAFGIVPIASAEHGPTGHVRGADFSGDSATGNVADVADINTHSFGVSSGPESVKIVLTPSGGSPIDAGVTDLRIYADLTSEADVDGAVVSTSDNTACIIGTNLANGTYHVGVTGATGDYSVAIARGVNTCDPPPAQPHSFGAPAIVINEVVADPQTDWNDTSGGDATAFNDTPGNGAVTDADQYIEFFVFEDIDISNYRLRVVDGQSFDFNNPIIYCTLSGTGCAQVNAQGGITSTPPTNWQGGSLSAGDYVVVGDFNVDIPNNALYILEDDSGNPITDVHTDGFMAPDATSADNTDESIGRDDQSFFSGFADFYAQAGTPGAANEYQSQLEVLGVFPSSPTTVIVDFTKAPTSATGTDEANYTFVDANSTPLTITQAQVDPFNQSGTSIELTLGSSLTEGALYTLTVSTNVVDKNSNPINSNKRTATLFAQASDASGPVLINTFAVNPFEIEIIFDEPNGLDVANGATVSVPGLTVANVEILWDIVRVRFTTAMTADQDYTVTVSNLDDLGGNTIGAGDGDGTFTGFNAAGFDDGQPPFVIGSGPFPGAFDVPINLENVVLGFSEDLDSATLTGNFSVDEINDAGVVQNNITIDTPVYDFSKKTVTLTFDTNATAPNILAGGFKLYRVTVTGGASGVKDLGGTPLQGNYKFDFRTTVSTDPDITPPSINYVSLDDFAGLADLPIFLPPVIVEFSEGMSGSTVATENAGSANSNITLTTTQNGSTSYVSGRVEYNHETHTANFFASEALAANATYTFKIKANGVADGAGNTLNSNFTRVFTTATATASDSTGPQIEFAECADKGCFVKFDKPLRSASAVNLSNYTINVGGSAASLASANATYLNFDNAVDITGLSLNVDQPVTISASVKDPNGNQGVSSFTTQVFNFSAFEHGLNVQFHYPFFDQRDVPINNSIVIEMSEDIDESTVVHGTSVFLRPITAFNSFGAPTVGSNVAATVSVVGEDIIVINPNASLSANTAYEVKIGADLEANSIVGTAGDVMPFPFFFQFKTGAVTDSTAPTVSSAFPAAGAISVSEPFFEILMGENIDPSTVNSGTVTLVNDANSQAVPGELEVFGDFIRFLPQNSLSASQAYTLTVSTGVTDLGGNALALDYTAAYTSGLADATSPEVVYAYGDDFGFGIQVNEAVKSELIKNPSYTTLTCEASPGSGDVTERSIPLSGSDVTVNYDPFIREVFWDHVSLTPGVKCQVTVKAQVKDLSGNAMRTDTDNSAGAIRNLLASDIQYNQFQFEIINKSAGFFGNFFAVEWVDPGPGFFDAPIGAPIAVVFTADVDADTIDADSFIVDKFNPATGQSTGVVTCTYSYNSETRTAFCSPSADLVAATDYRVRVTNAVLSDDGQTLGGFNHFDPNAPAWESFFRTKSGAGTDTDAPLVLGTSLDKFKNYSTGAISNVPDSIPSIQIRFNEGLDLSTFAISDMADSTVVFVAPSADPGAKVEGKVKWDPGMNAMRVEFDEELDAGGGQNFLLTVTTDVTDKSGNALAVNFTQTFGVIADVSPLYVVEADCDEFSCRARFNKPLNPLQATKVSSYDLESPIGVVKNLTGKTIEYRANENMVEIRGLTLSSDATFKFSADSTLTTNGGAAISTATDALGADFAGDPDFPRDVDASDNQFNEWEGYVWAHFDQAEFFTDQFATFDFGTATAAAKGDFFFNQFAGGGKPQIGLATPIQGQETTVFIDWPTTVSYPVGSIVKIAFPEGTDISSASIQPPCSTNFVRGCSPVNGDINGPAGDAVTMSNLTVNSSTNTVSFVVATSATQTQDFLTTDLGGFIFNDASVFGQSGQKVTISVFNASGQRLEGPLVSNEFFVEPAGTAKLSGDFTVGGAGVDGTMLVQLFNPKTGAFFDQEVTITDGVASYEFNALPQGDYEIKLPPFFQADGGEDFMLDPKFAHKPVVVGANNVAVDFEFEDVSAASNTADGDTVRTLTIDIASGPANKKVIVRAGNSAGSFEKEITLNGSGAVDDATMKVKVKPWDNFVHVCVDPYMPPFFDGPPPAMEFMPECQEVFLGAADATLSYTLQTNDQRAKITVQDADGNPLPNADVFMHNPFGGNGFGSGGRTGADGVATLNVRSGDYIVNVNVPGVISKQKNLKVTAANTAGNPATLTVQAKLDGRKISGTVVLDGDLVSDSPVYCNQTDSSGNFQPGFRNTVTNDAGAWSVWVKENTYWKCESFVPGFGPTDKLSVAVATSDVSSKVLTKSVDDLSTIDFTIQNNGQAVDNAFISFQKIGSNFGFVDVFTDEVGYADLKLEDGTYKVSVYDPSIGGEKVLDDALVISGDASLGNLSVSATEPTTLTVNVLDENGVAYSPDKVFIDVIPADGQGGNWGDFAAQSAGTVTVPQGQDYDVIAYVEGVGQIKLNDQDFDATTETINVELPASPKELSGTVKDDGAALEGAIVNIVEIGGEFATQVQTDASGNWVADVPADAELEIAVYKDEFLPLDPVSVTMAGEDATVATMAMSDESGDAGIFTVSGTVDLDGTEASDNAVVWFSDADNTYSAEVDENGNYEVVVPLGTYTMDAAADGFYMSGESIAVGSNMTGEDVSLTEDADYTKVPASSAQITPSKGALIEDATKGLALSVPAGALGDGGTKATLTVEETTNFVGGTANTTILSDSVISFSAKDANNQSITNFTSAIAVEYDFSDEYAAGNITDAMIQDGITMNYWDETVDQWIPIATTVDEENQTLSFFAEHFTEFGVGQNVGVVQSQGGNEGGNNQSGNSGSSAGGSDSNADSELVDAGDAAAGESAFADIVNHYAADAINELYALGVVSGLNATSYGPDFSLTRAQAVKIALNTFGYEVPDSVSETSFSDVSATEWYASFVQTAYDAGIVKGYPDGKFYPNKPMTRAEYLTVVLSASDLRVAGEIDNPFSDVPFGEWFWGPVMHAYSIGMVSGYADGRFGPNDEVTRGQAAIMAINALHLNNELPVEEPVSGS